MNIRVSPPLLATIALLLTCCAVAKAQDGSATLTGFEPAPDSLVLDAQPPDVFESEVARRNEELEQRVQQLEAQMNSLQSRPPASFNSVMSTANTSSGGLFGSTEVTFLKPYMSSALSVALGHGGNVFDSEYHSDVRYVLGYRGDSGFGVRGRYWSLDDHLPFSPTFATGAMSIDAQTADLEVTVQQVFRQMDLGLAAGIRYGSLQYGTIGATPLFSPGTLRFEGVGPTVSLDGQRRLGTSGLSLYGNGRASLLVGSINQGLVIPVGTAAKLNDEVMTIFENQLGASWSTPIHSSVLSVRAAWETQYWASGTLSDDFLGIGSNLLLMGPTLGVELRY